MAKSLVDKSGHINEAPEYLTGKVVIGKKAPAKKPVAKKATKSTKTKKG